MFVVICKKCQTEYEIKTDDDICQSPIYNAGYGGEIGLFCEECKNKITEGE